jgi:hypothetical protein
MRKLWLLALAGAMIANSSPIACAQGLVPTDLGANLERVRDWSRTGAFVDVVKQSRGFYKVGQGLTQPAATNAAGWPIEDFDVVLMTDITGQQGLAGTYKVSGTCNQSPAILAVQGQVTVANVVHDGATNSFTADVTLGPTSEGFILSFRNTNGGVQNLRVIRPGYDATNPPTFSTPFLSHLERFKTIRVMEWTQTNSHPVSKWIERTPADSPSYWVESGVPWEVCVDLANQSQKNLWINVPHLADAVYVKELAGLIHERLDPNLILYLEHSNEVWNGLFGQFQDNLAAAHERAEELDLYYDGTTADTIVNARYHAYRTHEIAECFRTVYGNEFNSRVRVVLAGQQVEPSLLYSGLDYLARRYGEPRNYLYAVATAPYFNMGASQFTDGLSPNDVILSLRDSVNHLAERELFEQNARLARWFNLPMLAYEGGSDTAGGASLEAKRTAMFDPRMYDLCTDYMREWYSWGFGEFQWFTGGATSWRTPSGAWGLTEDMAVQDTYKILALNEVGTWTEHPVTKGFLVPGLFDARKHVDRPADWATASESLDHVILNQDFDYIINSNIPGALRVRVAMGCEVPDRHLRISANGSFVGDINVPVTGGYYTYGFSETIHVPLTQGINVLRLTALYQGQYTILGVQILCPLDLDDDGNVANGLNPDGGVDISDLLAFLALFETGDVQADLDDDGLLPAQPDGGADINDLLFFLTRFEAGC